VVPVRDKHAHRTRKRNARAEAAEIVHSVIAQGRSLGGLKPSGQPDPKTDALIQELSYGTLRWYPRLQYFAGRLLNHPFKKRDGDLHALLLVGLYQLQYLDKPAHAVLHETVEAVGHLDKPWARGVVNAVLRNFQRRADVLNADADRDPETRWAHPAWLLEKLASDWPQHWQSIARENNQRPPMVLRVNRRAISRAAYVEKLRETGIEASPLEDSDVALLLSKPVGVERLPGFFEGLVSIQDAAAQKAAGLLDPRRGQRVLDACAAPGGKTCHLLESEPAIGELVAIDRDADRLRQVAQNLERLGLNATLNAVDAADTEAWWDGKPFERILLDAPCSSTGVIRRHPDIKVLRRASDIDALVGRQRRLLENLWPLLAPGGMLLYATCSVLACENHEQITGFLSTHADARQVALAPPWGHACAAGRQILPGEQTMDGFYFALLKKEPE
jgi:16S rRNA (cytosine967-C5)-methyltransferase